MELMLITNNVDMAMLAEQSKVDRIFIDLEIIGKVARQGHLNTVISGHSLKDVSIMSHTLNKSKLLVRVNPIHNNSLNEINEVVQRGADIVMLPMFKTSQEVKYFLECLDHRATSCLLLETSQALVRIDEILSIEGIDEIHIGLNDMHLALGLDFMFELLSGGIVEHLAMKIRNAGIKFGFGGISRLGHGLLEASLILSEHFRLGSKMAILSRDFLNYSKTVLELPDCIKMEEEVRKIKYFYENLATLPRSILCENQIKLTRAVNKILQIKNNTIMV